MGMEKLLTIAAGLYAAWMLSGIISTGSKIRVPGTVYGRRTTMGIFAVLFAVYIVLNRNSLLLYWYTYATIGLALVLYFCTRSGLGADGLYISGRFIPYSSVKSYAMDQEGEGKFTLRLEGKLKDYVLEFPATQRESIETAIKRLKLPQSKVRGRR